MIMKPNLDDAQSIANLGEKCAALTRYLPKSYKAIGRECTEMIFKQLSQDDTIPYTDRIFIAANVQQIIKHSQNQKSIIEIADKYLSTNPKEISPIDEDWFDLFLEECKTISDKDVQEIWGKVLAGKCEGKHYPKNFLIMLKTLEPSTAQNFQKLNDVKFSVFMSNNDIRHNLLFIINNKPINALGSFDLLELQNAGLINQMEMSFQYLEYDNPEHNYAIIKYHNKKIKIYLDGKNRIYLGNIVFTSNGRLLSEIIESNFNKDFVDYLLNNLSAGHPELL